MVIVIVLLSVVVIWLVLLMGSLSVKMLALELTLKGLVEPLTTLLAMHKLGFLLESKEDDDG